MLRKQLYLPEELDREIKLQALKQQKAEAEVVRELLYRGLKKIPRTKKKFKTPADFLLHMVSYNVKGQKDLSKNLDRYLYGDKSLEFGHLYRKKK